MLNLCSFFMFNEDISSFTAILFLYKESIFGFIRQSD